MKTATIYKTTCTNGYMMSEQGAGYSLEPWGEDTEYYEGYDDGGEDYILPEGFEVKETNFGEMVIYDDNNNHYTLISLFGNAALAGNGKQIRLKKADSSCNVFMHAKCGNRSSRKY